MDATIRKLREQEMADLNAHWGSAYAISRSGSAWNAVRRDGGSVVSAVTAQGLREKIRADYLAWRDGQHIRP